MAGQGQRTRLLPGVRPSRRVLLIGARVAVLARLAAALRGIGIGAEITRDAAGVPVEELRTYGAVAFGRAVGHDGPVSVRPEKIRLHHLDEMNVRDAGGQLDVDGACALEGVVTEVVYLGAATHSVVDVGDGVHLTVQQQNEESSIDHALARRGERVVLTWRREHVVRLDGGLRGVLRAAARPVRAR